jgi:hypothetical protein
MPKIAFLLALLAVIGCVQAACASDRDDKIKFVDSLDDADAIREKIRTEMDEYKRLKELSLKKKHVKTVPKEIESTTATTTTTTVAAEAVSSSTVRAVYFGNPDDDDEEETTDDSTDDGMTTTPKDRFILAAPPKCRSGERFVDGRCRLIVRHDDVE